MTSFLIAGGGTAGHTNPGIAVAQTLVAKGWSNDDVHFVGGERGNEGTLVPAAGFTIDLLPGRGLQRRLAPQNLGAARDLLRAFGRSFGIVRRHEPRAVLCLGGYAAFGPSVAAVLQRVPVVVTEQNARASLVNRILGRLGAACALPFPDTDLPNGVLTGNPILPAVREAVAETDRSEARRALDLPADRTIIAVWSGSLGARSVNCAVRDLARRWRSRGDLAIHHVIGRRDWSDHASDAAEFERAELDYRVIEYEDRMPLLLRAADVAVCRAGASTIAELTVAGLPAVLVPLPGAPRDHQTANAAEVVAAGGCVLLPDSELTVDRLEQCLTPMVDPGPSGVDRRTTMSDAGRSVARADAADAVADLLVAHGGEREAGE